MILTDFVANRKERRRFYKFAVVGVIGAVVDFGTFNLLTSVFDVQPVLASILSFIAAIISNFTWNRIWTYPDSRTKKPSKQMAQFAVVSAIGLGIRTPLFAFLNLGLHSLLENVETLPIGILTVEFLSHNVALACAVVVVMFWNFFINRFWTYNDVES